MNIVLKPWGYILCFVLLMVGCGTSDTIDPEPSTVIPPSLLDVSIPVTGLNLEGVLHLPERVESDPVGGVVLVHGSGPNSRDHLADSQLGMSFGGVEVMIFAEIALALQDAGYAVLRYDKRSCGSFNNRCNNSYPAPGPDVTVNDFVEDAVAAARWLKAQTAVDAEQVFVMGLSQGGEMVPAILDADTELAGGVSLAGPWRPIDEMLRHQLDFLRQILGEGGLTSTQIDSQLSSLIQMVDGIEALRSGTFEGSFISGASVEFWQSWMALGDAKPGLVAAETRPLLAINGDYDWNVPAEPELGLWSEAGVETVLISCVTHALNCLSNPNWQTIMPSDIGTEVHPELLSTIIEWLDGQTGKSQE